MNKLHFIVGSALEPVKKPAFIIHIVNDIGKWGSGFVIAISNKYKNPEKTYLEWYERKKKIGQLLPLGIIQAVPVEEDITIINMVAQHGIKSASNKIPIKYKSLESCLHSVYSLAEKKNWTVHMPRIGAVRSGGDWGAIENIINKCASVNSYIYTLEAEKDMWKCDYEVT